jgi:hypothetical protein
MSPTRELASQTEKNIMALGEFMKVRAHCCIGGKSIGEWNVITSTGCVLPSLQVVRSSPCGRSFQLLLVGLLCQRMTITRLTPDIGSISTSD